MFKSTLNQAIKSNKALNSKIIQERLNIVSVYFNVMQPITGIREPQTWEYVFATVYTAYKYIYLHITSFWPTSCLRATLKLNIIVKTADFNCLHKDISLTRY